MNRLLLIDDDIQLTSLLAEYLQKDGFDVTSYNDGFAGLSCLQQQQFDLLILDIMMPTLDGISLLKRLRQTNNMPVIMLTARGDEFDRVVGLELGADDYLAKPCLPRELTARIRAILRRVQQPSKPQQHSALQYGALMINTVNRSVYVDQKLVELTGAEFNVLYLLTQNAGQILSKAALSEQALGRALSSFDRSIDVHISHIRQKLGKLPNGQYWITAVRGKGYQFTYAKTL
ncbi:response regulator transcription factor [Rheinheimera baltica]|uniref:Response regulator transcription factor n=1 Tax=Rheinheimera baltica TaxID=67576 RepID=A0ABT9I4Y2_9GAMM|nr:response regulator transcription factor [Rheinheimera baltica]MDP5138445.1 response regulator transcription factor [Rheinheimera baltica]MDP5141798.1 response regulator transcription factor [Rheinheimera baltica]MDP5150221.1 response regulator transcription factor [Rheinheimera baltica]MDP5190480.1 response regulator transcription factor [Rheinheimera baltica]